MPLGLLIAVAFGANANPLIGTWVSERPVPRLAPAIAAASPSAPQPTMTISRDAISFGEGRRQLGIVPISAFERSDGTLDVRTRFGDLYRFRFQGADHICRVADMRATGRAVPAQCFTRSGGRS